MVWAPLHCRDDCCQRVIRRYNYHRYNDTAWKIRYSNYSRTIERIWIQILRLVEQKKYNEVEFICTKIGRFHMERRYIIRIIFKNENLSKSNAARSETTYLKRIKKMCFIHILAIWLSMSLKYFEVFKNTFSQNYLLQYSQPAYLHIIVLLECSFR